MTENIRDTKFAGFAKLLMNECDPKDYLWPEIRARYEQIIAQRAYDLVDHTIDCMKPYIYDDLTAGFESVNDVSDLDKWPTE